MFISVDTILLDFAVMNIKLEPLVEHGKIFFSNGSTAPWGPRPPHFSRFHDHT
jgi:hypothetical protein